MDTTIVRNVYIYGSTFLRMRKFRCAEPDGHVDYFTNEWYETIVINDQTKKDHRLAASKGLDQANRQFEQFCELFGI